MIADILLTNATIVHINKTMHTPTEILQKLTAQGHRLTAVRRALVDYFLSINTPGDVEGISAYLATRSLQPNKTTIYRELDFLVAQGIIQDVDFGEGKKRYELALEHHHHLICTNCKEVDAVHIEEDNLTLQEEKVLQEKGFKISRHMLEFFGLCKKCRKSAA
jgi:Fe2+ or Zn2+ uptake regulation protein